MTSLLNSIKNLAKQTGEDTKTRFSVSPSPGDSGFTQWQNGMRAVARLPEGIPPQFRKTLWLNLAEKHLASRGVQWHQVEEFCFNEFTNPDDEELGVQIVKDVHRTGCSLFCGVSGKENQALLKRVLLAYARWNKAVGYCQGFNMLAALILQVMDKSEVDSVKVMIYLIEGVLPESYFANNLRGLSVDMAVFRDLLRLKLPTLSRHFDQLQSDSKDSGTSYEPPLTNVFTMQWFLTLFCNCLPQDTVLRVWDLIFLEGNHVLLCTALAIWSTLADRILTVESADEFYCIMGVLTREMLEFGLMDANALIKAIVSFSLPELPELREKYLYNITPWTQSVSTVAKRGLRLFYSDEDTDTEEDDEKIAIATAYGLFRSPKKKDGIRSPPSALAHPDREKIAMDISALTKQYRKLRERQKQAHVILTAACGSQSFVGPGLTSSPAMNHLLMGKFALVNSKGRRLGPPPGSIPPPSQPRPSQGEKQKITISGETLHWKDAVSTKKPLQKENGSDEEKSPESSHHSSRRSSSSSTSTELCDDPQRLSDSETNSLSESFPPADKSEPHTPMKSSHTKGYHPDDIASCKEESEETLNKYEQEKAPSPIELTTKTKEDTLSITPNEDSRSITPDGEEPRRKTSFRIDPEELRQLDRKLSLKIVEIERRKSSAGIESEDLDKVLFSFDRDYIQEGRKSDRDTPSSIPDDRMCSTDDFVAEFEEETILVPDLIITHKPLRMSSLEECDETKATEFGNDNDMDDDNFNNDEQENFKSRADSLSSEENDNELPFETKYNFDELFNNKNIACNEKYLIDGKASSDDKDVQSYLTENENEQRNTSDVPLDASTHNVAITANTSPNEYTKETKHPLFGTQTTASEKISSIVESDSVEVSKVMSKQHSNLENVSIEKSPSKTVSVNSNENKAEEPPDCNEKTTPQKLPSVVDTSTNLAENRMKLEKKLVHLLPSLSLYSSFDTNLPDVAVVTSREVEINMIREKYAKAAQESIEISTVNMFKPIPFPVSLTSTERSDQLSSEDCQVVDDTMAQGNSTSTSDKSIEKEIIQSSNHMGSDGNENPLTSFVNGNSSTQGDKMNPKGEPHEKGTVLLAEMLNENQEGLSTTYRNTKVNQDLDQTKSDDNETSRQVENKIDSFSETINVNHKYISPAMDTNYTVIKDVSKTNTDVAYNEATEEKETKAPAEILCINHKKEPEFLVDNLSTEVRQDEEQIKQNSDDKPSSNVFLSKTKLISEIVHSNSNEVLSSITANVMANNDLINLEEQICSKPATDESEESETSKVAAINEKEKIKTVVYHCQTTTQNIIDQLEKDTNPSITNKEPMTDSKSFEDHCEVNKETASLTSSPSKRRGSEVALDLILKENLQILSKIQQQNRRKSEICMDFKNEIEPPIASNESETAQEKEVINSEIISLSRDIIENLVEVKESSPNYEKTSLNLSGEKECDDVSKSKTIPKTNSIFEKYVDEFEKPCQIKLETSNTTPTLDTSGKPFVKDDDSNPKENLSSFDSFTLVERKLDFNGKSCINKPETSNRNPSLDPLERCSAQENNQTELEKKNMFENNSLVKKEDIGGTKCRDIAGNSSVPSRFCKTEAEVNKVNFEFQEEKCKLPDVCTFDKEVKQSSKYKESDESSPKHLLTGEQNDLEERSEGFINKGFIESYRYSISSNVISLVNKEDKLSISQTNATSARESTFLKQSSLSSSFHEGSKDFFLESKCFIPKGISDKNIPYKKHLTDNLSDTNEDIEEELRSLDINPSETLEYCQTTGKTRLYESETHPYSRSTFKKIPEDSKLSPEEISSRFCKSKHTSLDHIPDEISYRSYSQNRFKNQRAISLDTSISSNMFNDSYLHEKTKPFVRSTTLDDDRSLYLSSYKSHGRSLIEKGELDTLKTLSEDVTDLDFTRLKGSSSTESACDMKLFNDTKRFLSNSDMPEKDSTFSSLDVKEPEDSSLYSYKRYKTSRNVSPSRYRFSSASPIRKKLDPKTDALPSLYSSVNRVKSPSPTSFSSSRSLPSKEDYQKTDLLDTSYSHKGSADFKRYSRTESLDSNYPSERPTSYLKKRSESVEVSAYEKPFEDRKPLSPTSPVKFNPFPVRSSFRQPKELGVKLGLYLPQKSDKSPSKRLT